MIQTYVVTIAAGDDGYLVAECPSLPGCVSQGRTREEALANIEEAIQLYIEPVDDDLSSCPGADVVEIVV